MIIDRFSFLVKGLAMAVRILLRDVFLNKINDVLD